MFTSLKCFLCFSIFSSLLPGTQGPDDQVVTVTLGAPYALSCTQTGDTGNFSNVGWYRCNTSIECRTHWDKFRIAHIKNMKDKYVDYPDLYDITSNGTLIIWNILPRDDGKSFVCLAKKPEGVVQHTTILRIAKDSPSQAPSTTPPSSTYHPSQAKAPSTRPPSGTYIASQALSNTYHPSQAANTSPPPCTCTCKHNEKMDFKTAFIVIVPVLLVVIFVLLFLIIKKPQLFCRHHHNCPIVAAPGGCTGQVTDKDENNQGNFVNSYDNSYFCLGEMPQQEGGAEKL